MNRNMISWLLILGLASVASVGAGFWAATADAAAPWNKLFTRNRVDADPDKAYRLSEENGPWMIMACSFSGEEAEQQAQDLTYELRQRYKLEAYVHKMQFNFGETSGRGIDQFGASVRMRYRRGDEAEEVAVLVGNYQGVDDPEAQKTLQKLKYSQPGTLKLEKGKATNRSLAAWRHIQKQILAPGSEKKKKGPMNHAFVTTNPLLPKDYFAAPGLDKMVLGMNKDVPHSLLDCPGKYTVQVATFKGEVIIEPSKIREIEQGKKVKSKLAEAAEKAHKLTEALRMKGWEAYEFHDRYASIVTVGSFDSVGNPRADGLIEMNPRVRAITRTFTAEPTNQPTPPGTLPNRVKTVLGIPFDVQPRLVHVPKRSISQEMAHGLF